MKTLQIAILRVLAMFWVFTDLGAPGWADEVSEQPPKLGLREYKCRLKPEFKTELFDPERVTNKGEMARIRLLLRQWLAADGIAISGDEISLAHLSPASMRLVVRGSDKALHGIERALMKRSMPREPSVASDEGIPVDLEE